MPGRAAPQPRWRCPLTRWTDELLDRARERGDPPADAVLADLHSAHGLTAVNEVLATLVRNEGAPPAALPPIVRRYLADQLSPPTPEERPLVAEAEAFFATHGVSVLMLLGFSSLPQTYASKNGSHVLVFTQRLTRDTQRRVMETFQFVMNALSPGGLAPGGRGLRDAQKVRLMHAAVRRFVAAQPDYDPAWGRPVNQEDMAGTLLAFSTVILDGFRTLRIPVSAREERAFFTAWQVVGRNLGVEPALMPATPDEGRALMQRIRDRQWGPSDSGRALTQAIVAFYDRFMPGVFQSMPATQIRWFAGDVAGDALGLPPADWTAAVIAAANFLDREVHVVEDHWHAASVVGRHVTLGVLKGMEDLERGGDRPLFQIPLPLRGRWFPDEPDDGRRVDVETAVERAIGRLRSLQQPDGSWWDRNRGGAAMNGMWLCAEAFCGTLEPAARDAGVRWLRTQQTGDGGFGDSVGATTATEVATLTVLAGLVAARVPEQDGLVVGARGWLARHHGIRATDPVTGAFLAMAGLVRPSDVPGPPMAIAAVPFLPRALARELQGFYLLVLFEVPAILDGLRHGRTRPPPWRPGRWWVRHRALRYLTRRQNRAGSWLGVMPVTALGLCALVAQGVPLTDDRVARGLAALRRLLVPVGDAVQAQPYTSEVWDTAMICRTLAAAGVPAADPQLRRGLAFLRAEQGRDREPWDLQTPRPGAPRDGGWPFEAGNELGLDPDSTGMVLACLRRAGAPEDHVANEASVQKGLAWMLGMQNPDGGWPAFGWGQASKPRGPIGDQVITPPEGLVGVVKQLLDPPAILRDPSTEELTGRALLALGTLGFDAARPEVQAALRFLRDQVWTNDAWWGRWTTNFVASTSYVLVGLAAVGVPATDPLVEPALDWLLAFQHADGGWGEGTATYANPELAGRGHPSPTQTALALWALCAHGKARTKSVERGVRWLLRAQEAGGGWTDPDALSVLVPPTMFYGEDVLPDYLGLQALAVYRAAWAP